MMAEPEKRTESVGRKLFPNFIARKKATCTASSTFATLLKLIRLRLEADAVELDIFKIVNQGIKKIDSAQ
jgi:hypothetical protein